MKKLILIVMASLLVASCDREVSRTPLPARESVKEIDCEHWGFCYHYDYSDSEYKWGVSSSCEGHQSAKIRTIPYRSVYESGKESIWETTETVERYGECK